jgi:hypothetical protein
MRRLHITIFLPAMLSCLLYSTGTAAQSAHLKGKLTLSQAERLAVDLKQGMTLEEVEKLLGKPNRTALRTGGYRTTPEASQNTLQWTYSWPNLGSEHSLQVVFVSKSPERWIVNSWDWTGY